MDIGFETAYLSSPVGDYLPKEQPHPCKKTLFNFVKRNEYI